MLNLVNGVFILCGRLGQMYARWRPWASDGTELWDHALSDSELDLICGVYSAPTGNVHVSYVLLDPY